MNTPQNTKTVIGLLLGFGIGLGCNLGGVPSPAPPVLTGALLVVAMTVGWTLTDRWFRSRPSKSEPLCGGPTGTPGAQS